jgi:hypothetical protein
MALYAQIIAQSSMKNKLIFVCPHPLNPPLLEGEGEKKTRTVLGAWLIVL